MPHSPAPFTCPIHLLHSHAPFACPIHLPHSLLSELARPMSTQQEEIIEWTRRRPVCSTRRLRFGPGQPNFIHFASQNLHMTKYHHQFSVSSWLPHDLLKIALIFIRMERNSWYCTILQMNGVLESWWVGFTQQIISVSLGPVSVGIFFFSMRSSDRTIRGTRSMINLGIVVWSGGPFRWFAGKNARLRSEWSVASLALHAYVKMKW